MRHLHNPAIAADIRDRLAQPDASARWGRMNVSQALAHLANAMEMALGDRKPPRMLIGRVIGPFVKNMALRDEAPLKRNTPTAPTLLIRDDRDFLQERQRLEALIQRFCVGEAACTSHPHTFFGAMSPREWAVLQYKHLDHHLRQFGA